MEIKTFFNKIFDFSLKRFAELIGLFLIISSILLFLSLISYSPDDPNFIFPENTEINNILGSKGSFTSDIFYQSIGLISILIPITIFFTGINVFIKGAANNINITANFDLCLIPVPKFPTPIPNTKI